MNKVHGLTSPGRRGRGVEDINILLISCETQTMGTQHFIKFNTKLKIYSPDPDSVTSILQVSTHTQTDRDQYMVVILSL